MSLSKRDPTTDYLEDHAGRSAFAEAINLVGCAITLPDRRHFKGARGEHTFSSALRFAISCRRWLELRAIDCSKVPINCILEIDGQHDRAPIVENLGHAINRIIHSKRLAIFDTPAKLQTNPNAHNTLLQRDLYVQKRPLILLKAESDYPIRTIPLIAMLDAYFSLLPEPMSKHEDSDEP